MEIENNLKIKVIGVGGGGNNAVTSIIKDKVKYIIIEGGLNDLQHSNTYSDVISALKSYSNTASELIPYKSFLTVLYTINSFVGI